MANIRVILAEPAQQDVMRLLTELRVVAPKRAFRLGQKLEQLVERLSLFPASGRNPLELTDDESVREVVVEQLRVFYQYSPTHQTVTILAVFNARQNVATLYHARLGVDDVEATTPE